MTLEERAVYPLVLAFVVDVVEAAQHFEGGDVGTGVIDYALATVLDQVLEQLKSLCQVMSSMYISW